MNSSRSVLQQVFSRRMLICVCIGFSSGMPLYVLIQLVPAWLFDAGVSLTDIGLFALVGIPYNWKFIWAPLMDRFVPLGLGRRRSWMLVFQLLLLVGIGFLGSINPALNTSTVAVLAVVIACFSASQDIAIDAYRRELLPDRELGLGSAVHVQAYRLSGLVPGGLSLILADQLPWESVFWVTGAFMLLGAVTSFFVSEPESRLPRASGIRDTFVAPFAEYIQRKGWGALALVLAFLVLYKIGDNMATALSTPFYLDIGFSKTQIGLVAKNAGLWPAIVGGILGGVLMLKIGINRALWLFGVVQIVSILGFAVLASQGPVLWLLAAAIAFEYFGVGLGTAAFTAFIARETSPLFAATQYALFTALAAVPRTFANASTGYIVEQLDWVSFFILCSVVALPGLALLPWVAPWGDKPEMDGDDD